MGRPAATTTLLTMPTSLRSAGSYIYIFMLNIYNFFPTASIIALHVSAARSSGARDGKPDCRTSASASISKE